MDSLSGFYKHSWRVLKGLRKDTRLTILVLQLILMPNVILVLCFGFNYRLLEAILISVFVPVIFIWIPIIWKNWKKGELPEEHNSI